MYLCSFRDCLEYYKITLFSQIQILVFVLRFPLIIQNIYIYLFISLMVHIEGAYCWVFCSGKLN